MGEIVSAWISHLKSQEESAPGALGAFLGYHWDAECKRQITLNHPAVVEAHAASKVASQQWYPPLPTSSESSVSRSSVGPIGYIIDLHAAWHEKMNANAAAFISMEASILIPAGYSLPYISLGRPLNSNYTIPRKAVAQPSRPDSPDVAQPSLQADHHPPAVAQPSFRADNNTKKRKTEQRQPAVQSKGSYYGPAQKIQPVPREPCQGCGRLGHSPDNCPLRMHPN